MLPRASPRADEAESAAESSCLARGKTDLDPALPGHQRSDPDPSVLLRACVGTVEVQVRGTRFDPGDHDKPIMGVSGRTLKTCEEDGHTLLKNVEGDRSLRGGRGPRPRLQTPSPECPAGINLDDEAEGVVAGAENVGRAHFDANQG